MVKESLSLIKYIFNVGKKSTNYLAHISISKTSLVHQINMKNMSCSPNQYEKTCLFHQTNN